MRSIFVQLIIVIAMGSTLEVRAICSLDPSPPCQAFWQAEVVFTGTVISGTYSGTYQRGEGADKWNYRDRIAHFSVDEVFRGKLGAQVDVIATERMPTPIILANGSPGFKSAGESDCEYRFKGGERYLVYAHFRKASDGTLFVGYNRTRPVSQAADDLGYIRSVDKLRPLGRVYGVATQRDRNFKNDSNSTPARPIGNMEIVLKGQTQDYRAFTNDQGYFELGNLPPGDYELDPKYPRELTAYPPSKVHVIGRGCVEVNLYTEGDARISGRVFDDQGRLVPKMRLDLAPADQDHDERNPSVLSAYTDDEGRFEFKSVPKGRYVLGIRLNAIREPEFAYPRAYFPGASEPAGAKIFEVQEGQRIGDVDFVLPPRLAPRTISGEVVWPDGRPVAGASILLMITEYPVGFAQGGIGASDEMGKFSLTAFDGLSYWINATIGLENGRQMHAEPVDVTRNGDVRGMKLVVTSPMGNCERCRYRYWPKKKL
jgi:hypothetical protein